MHFRIDGNGYGGGSHGGGAGGHGGLSGGGSVVDAVAGTVAGSALPSANAVTAADFGHGLHGPSARSRSSSSDPRHLTGEMINRMNAFRKKDNATIAASLADCHRQQMQMQAIYERALRVSFFSFKSTNIFMSFFFFKILIICIRNICILPPGDDITEGST